MAGCKDPGHLVAHGESTTSLGPGRGPFHVHAPGPHPRTIGSVALARHARTGPVPLVQIPVIVPSGRPPAASQPA